MKLLATRWGSRGTRVVGITLWVILLATRWGVEGLRGLAVDLFIVIWD